jgi:hypothetical protein
MRKLFLLLFTTALGFGQQDNLDWILAQMMNNSIESNNILKLYNDLPNELSYTTHDGTEISTKKSSGTYSYLDLSSKENILKSMSVNIHEICHGITSLYFFKEMKSNYLPHDFKDIRSYFYISDKNNYISIFKGKVFPSSELANIIPEALVTSRYETYIKGDSSTQVDGIIGLLDEFNAYYHSSKFSFDMLPIYKEIYPSDYLMEWVMELQSEMTAYHEFDFWIKEYILHSKIYYPELYYEIMKKDSAFQIYKDIRKKYKNLISKYSSVVENEKVKMNYYYSTEFWEDDYFRLINRLSNKRYDFINNLIKS